MKRFKKFIGTAVVASLMVLAGCGAESGSTNSGNEDGTSQENTASGEVTKMSIATGGTTGVYFPIGAAIAQAINTHDQFQVNTQSTGGSIANMRMIDNGEVELFLSASNTAYAGLTGDDPFDAPIDHIRSITSLYPETFQFVVRKNSGMETIYDLKGKRIAVGAPGSGTERTGRLMLEAHGISYDEITPEFLGFGDAVTALQDQGIDAAIIGSGVPTAAVVDAASSMDINLLTVDEERFAEFIKSEPFIIMDTIPAGTYNGVEVDVVTAASPALLLTSSNRNEDEVYEITKTLFDNLQTVQDAHVQGKNISFDSALEGLSIPLHPGAAKYYEEQGIDVSDK
ncbi:TAXI family TRAP transporter solute-binding subunit [Alkalihalobacterium elongatum]|uniref:TAXI family TRAP transporter solute-binding subunit n=1 Tax=Alkalihalobacterium elongatum TaxID=2675466 RepID=UPI001C1FF39B|nr:TAXI family TRAP transporter solute-binding subunit [Alkalihalobacterium elongatum]